MNQNDQKLPEKANNQSNNDDSDEGDYEWEYFYEDAELKNPEQQPEPKQNVTQPIPNANPGKTQKVNPRDGWVCPTCTLLNEPNRPGCEACTTERPKDYKVPPPGPADTIPRGATAAAKPPPPAGPAPPLPGAIGGSGTPGTPGTPGPSGVQNSQNTAKPSSSKEVKAPETVSKEKVRQRSYYKRYRV